MTIKISQCQFCYEEFQDGNSLKGHISGCNRFLNKIDEIKQKYASQETPLEYQSYIKRVNENQTLEVQDKSLECRFCGKMFSYTTN